MTASSFEHEARSLKAAALFAALVASHVTTEMIRESGTPVRWDLVAKLAGVNEPSETTQALVLRMLERYEKVREGLKS